MRSLILFYILSISWSVAFCEENTSDDNSEILAKLASSIPKTDVRRAHRDS